MQMSGQLHVPDAFITRARALSTHLIASVGSIAGLHTAVKRNVFAPPRNEPQVAQPAV
jgi:hypothetical protein